VQTAAEQATASSGRPDVTRWRAVLADPEREARFRAARAPVMRRDVQVVAAAVAAYNLWYAAAELLAATGLRQALGQVANNAVLLLACVVVVVAVRRSRTWRGAASLLVAGVGVYTAVTVWGVLAHAFSPQNAVLIVVMSSAVLYLHAQMPLVVTACVNLGWTVVSTTAVAVVVTDDDVGVLVEGVVLVVLVNLVGLAATRRTARGERMLFAEREEVQRLSTTDALTGTGNRRRWEQHLEVEWARGEREGWPVGLLLVDVDDFKAVNDRFGHAGGDEVLRRVAAALEARARRAGDLVARLGGDEFAVVLPGASDDDVRTLAQELLDEVRAVREGAGPADPASALALSVGAGTAVPGRGCSWAEAVAAVDAQLYRAKAEGRDRVRWAAPVAAVTR